MLPIVPNDCILRSIFCVHSVQKSPGYQVVVLMYQKKLVQTYVHARRRFPSHALRVSGYSGAFTTSLRKMEMYPI